MSVLRLDDEETLIYKNRNEIQAQICFYLFTLTSSLPNHSRIPQNLRGREHHNPSPFLILFNCFLAAKVYFGLIKFYFVSIMDAQRALLDELMGAGKSLVKTPLIYFKIDE